MDPATFITKWNRAELSERAASQEHFLDLCRLLGVKTPAELDPTGEVFTFEKGVAVAGPASAGSSGRRGFADVWYKDRFGWEYKRKGKYTTLDEALRQLLQISFIYTPLIARYIHLVLSPQDEHCVATQSPLLLVSGIYRFTTDNTGI